MFVVLSGIAVFIGGMLILYFTRGSEHSIGKKERFLRLILSAFVYVIGGALIGFLVIVTIWDRNPGTAIIGMGLAYLVYAGQLFRWLGIEEILLSLGPHSNQVIFGFGVPFLGLASMCYFIVRTVAFFRKE